MEKDMESYLIKKLMQVPLTDKQKYIIEFTDNLIGKEMIYVCHALNNMPDFEMELKKSVIDGIILNVVSCVKTTDEMLSILEGCKKTIILLDTEFNKK